MKPISPAVSCVQPVAPSRRDGRMFDDLALRILTWVPLASLK